MRLHRSVFLYVEIIVAQAGAMVLGEVNAPKQKVGGALRLNAVCLQLQTGRWLILAARHMMSAAGLMTDALAIGCCKTVCMLTLGEEVNIAEVQKVLVCQRL